MSYTFWSETPANPLNGCFFFLSITFVLYTCRFWNAFPILSHGWRVWELKKKDKLCLPKFLRLHLPEDSNNNSSGLLAKKPSKECLATYSTCRTYPICWPGKIRMMEKSENETELLCKDIGRPLFLSLSLILFLIYHKDSNPWSFYLYIHAQWVTECISYFHICYFLVTVEIVFVGMMIKFNLLFPYLPFSLAFSHEDSLMTRSWIERHIQYFLLLCIYFISRFPFFILLHWWTICI